MNLTRPTSAEFARNTRQQAVTTQLQLTQLVAENARLRTIAINVMLEIEALRERLPRTTGE